MLQIPRLDEVIRVTDNAGKLAAAGFSFDEIHDLKKQEVLQQMNSAKAMGNGPQFGVETGFTTGPRRYAEGGTINIAPNGRLLMKPSQPGVVPPEIAAANPGAYYSPKRKSVVIGDPKRNTEKAVGGFTWSGPAIKDGQFFANTGAKSFNMPGPGERRGTIGGRATPPAPDMFGRQFMKPTGPAPEGTMTSGGVSRAPKPWEVPGYSDGGTIIGPGGPKDDMIPAMVDGMEPIAVSNGERITKKSTASWMGERFFEELDAKADKERAEAERRKKMAAAKGHTEEGHGEKPGFAMGGTIPAPTLAVMTESAANARLDRGLSPEPYGPTMNDHPAFQPAPASPPVAPAPSAMITPVMEPQPMTAQFAPRTVGEPAAPPRPSNAPFLAPWEKDAARAAAADAASGRPAGVRKSDWRKMQSDPKFILGQQMRRDQMERDARDERRIEDERKVRWNERMAEFNQNLAARQIQQQAEDQQWKDRMAVTENFRMAGENQRLASEASLNAATEARKKQALSEWTPIPNSNLQINGLGHVVGREGKAFSMEEAQKLGLELDSIDSEGRARWKRPDAGSPMMKDLYDGSISGVPTTLQFNPRTGQWERPVIAAGAELKTGGEAPAAAAPAVAPAPAAGEFKVTARTTKEEVAALPAGTRVVMPDGTVKFKK